MPITDLQLQTLARDAMQRAAAGDYAGAEPLFAEVVAARPNSGQALHLLGQARLKLGRFAEAREPLERAATTCASSGSAPSKSPAVRRWVASRARVWSWRSVIGTRGL